MKYEEIDDIILIRLSQDVNVSEAKDFSNLLEFFIQKGFSKFIIDFSETKFVSSAFLSILVSTKKRLFSSKGNIILVNINPNIYKIFEITELVSFFDIFHSIDEGIEEFEKKY